MQQKHIDAPCLKQMSAKLSRASDNTWIAHHGQFTLKTAFQPIFKFVDGALRPAAFEALLRPFVDDVPVIPGAFFQNLSHEDRLMIEVLSRTLHTRNASTLHPHAKRLFLNFDPSALVSEHNLDKMLNHLATEIKMSNLAPNEIVCEITERSAPNKAILDYFVYSLRSRGYMIAVDDFGTQASDMKRIRDLTPDIVKLDGGMVKRLMETPAGFTQIKDMLIEFKKLRITSILEGIEDMWQIEMAQSAGAELIQGFAAAVPRTLPSDFDDWFENDSTVVEKPFLSKPASA